MTDTYTVQYRLIRGYTDDTDQWCEEDVDFDHHFDLSWGAAAEHLTQDVLDYSAWTMVSDRDWLLKPGSYCIEATVTRHNGGQSHPLEELTRRSADVEVEAEADA